MTTSTAATPLILHDIRPNTHALREEILASLQKLPKELPCKLLYDQQGSQLFDQICELEEYYPTRTETTIMQDHIAEIAKIIGPQVLLIEYGSGSSLKTQILLEHLPNLTAYIPLDISTEHLTHAVTRLTTLYPHLDIIPIVADYTKPFTLPAYHKSISRRVIYFPGSTIGNFHPSEALKFLKRIADVCGPSGGLLLGVDLKKDLHMLRRAYDDCSGITAAFNLNILKRLNRELGTRFQIDQFRHHVHYDEVEGRIEMHLVSLTDQTVHLDGIPITLTGGESIWTESSYKYTVEEFSTLVKQAGFKIQQVWKDKNNLFSVQYMTVAL